MKARPGRAFLRLKRGQHPEGVNDTRFIEAVLFNFSITLIKELIEKCKINTIMTLCKRQVIDVSAHTAWEALKTIFLIGFALSALFTLLISRDSSFKIRLFTSGIIGLTWPLSFPVVLLFSLF